MCISQDRDNEIFPSFTGEEHCIADIPLWMIQNLLKLSDNKANIIYLSSLNYVKSLNHTSIIDGCMFHYPLWVTKESRGYF